nr:RNA-directed DNA polymerase, eukaryota [Tanacetum cinerariifolium]
MRGLGIGSTFALNVDLLFKWIWWFLGNSYDLWIKVTKDIYREIEDESWWGNSPLKSLFPRIYMLDNDKGCNVANRVCLQDWNHVLKRPVRGVRSLIDSCTLEVSPIFTRWNRSIPIKVNIFLWRLLLNKLPIRVNLDRRRIDVHSMLCPICQEVVEMVNHIFFSCEMATELWSLLEKW